MENPKKNIGLVLSGGGAKGAFQAGVIHSLVNSGYKFSCVSGTSVGALNGSAVSIGREFDLEKIWMSISKKKVIKTRSIMGLARRQAFSWFRINKPPLGINDTSPLRKTLKEVLGTKTPTMPFYAPRVNLINGKYESEVQNDKFIDQVLASASIPIIFDPVIFNRRHKIMVDGGVRNISPIKDILHHDVSSIIVITNDKLKSAPNDVRVNNFVDAVKQTIGIMLNEIFVEDLTRFSEINSMVKQANAHNIQLEKKNGEPYRYYRTQIIQPQYGLGDPLDFSRKSIKERFDHGKLVAESVKTDLL